MPLRVAYPDPELSLGCGQVLPIKCNLLNSHPRRPGQWQEAIVKMWWNRLLKDDAPIPLDRCPFSLHRFFNLSQVVYCHASAACLVSGVCVRARLKAYARMEDGS